MNKRNNKSRKRKEEVMKRYLASACAVFFVIASLVVSAPVYATNGMNLEGYGPIATGMGGASMAYDNGDAALMNNPATLGLMPAGNRLDAALGYLGPHVSAELSGTDAKSSSTAFFMPAIGWVKKPGAIAYGLGMFGQGGMGTEYAADSFLAHGSGEKVRSEVSVGRVIAPLAYEVNKDLIIGGSLDFVWAGMDLKMAMTGLQFFNMAGMDPSTSLQNQYGTASGSMVNTFALMYGALNPANPVPWARFDFSNSSQFTGEATGVGYGAKLGAVYKVNPKLTVGAAYHSKTALSDLETSNAKVSFNVNMDMGLAGGGASTGFTNATIPLTGKISVKDFEWPQMVGLGAAYQATDKLMIVADFKWINWADVMKNFKMTFTADSTQAGLAQGFAGTVLDATMFQKWKDQHVIMIGAGYQVAPEWTLRAGLNLANNPIPDTYLNALFPAIERNHVTLGAGYMISKAQTVDASFTYAPEVKKNSGANAPEGAAVAHSQTNAQLMYSYRF